MEFLTTINEGDEHVSLGDVLALRDSCLTEAELWAVCRECCLALQGIHVSSDIFQTLCITPDAMCFDQGGTVCFLDLYIDPEPMYVPPEYEKMGNSYKSHLYSLGMTLLFAAEYNVSMAGTRQFSTELGHTINKMTLDDLEMRAGLEYVVGMCDQYLGERASDAICQQVVAVAQSDTSCEDDRISADFDQLLPLDAGKPANHLSHLSPTLKLKHSFPSSRKRASPVDLSDSDNPKGASGGSPDPHSRRTAETHTTPAAKVKKTGTKDVLKKRDPLGKILRTTYIEAEDFSDDEDEFGKKDETDTASLDDITLLPPVANDLDLLQWDSDFLLSSYSNVRMTSSDTFDDDYIGGASGGTMTEEGVEGRGQGVNNSVGIEGWGNEDLQDTEDKEPNASEEVGLNEVEFSLVEGEEEPTTEVRECKADPSEVNHSEIIEGGGADDEHKKSPQGAGKGIGEESQTLSEGHSGLSSPPGKSDGGPIQGTDPNNSISEQRDLKGTSNNKDISEGDGVLSEFKNTQKGYKEGSVTSVQGATVNGSEELELEYLKRQVSATDDNSADSSICEDNNLLSIEQGSPLSSSLSISQGSRVEDTSSATSPTFQVSSDSGGDTTLDLSQSGSWENPSQSHDTGVFPPLSPTSPATVVDEAQTAISGVTTARTISSELASSSVNTGQTTSEGEQKKPAYDWSCPLESGNRPDNHNTGLTESVGENAGDYINVLNNSKQSTESGPSGVVIEEVGTEEIEQGKEGSKETIPACQSNGLDSESTGQGTQGTGLSTSEDSKDTQNTSEGLQEQPKTNTPVIATTPAEVVTIKFNAVFGKHIHRDTSKDTLNQDIVSDSGKGCANQGELSVNALTEQNKDNVMISGDLNAQQNGTVVDSAKAVDSMEKSGARRKDKGVSGHPEGPSVLEILDRLGCGFHENEVWALCRECVLAMQRNRLQLPAYVSLETVALEDGGRVVYRPVPEDKELEVVFLAPELQKYGVITEKTCLFGVAAMLWSAADYRLPANQEPALSEELENLLISMTQDDSDLRPTAIEVLQSCNEFQKKQTTTSTQICQSLVTDAKKALDYGKGNSLVKDILEEQIENEVKSHKAEVVKVIQGQPLVTLKPASERTERPQVESEPTLHEKLMALIREPPRKLRRSSKPRVQTVGDIYLANPDLLVLLKKVTGVNQEEVTELAPPTSTTDSAPTSNAATVSTTSAFTSIKNESSVPEAVAKSESSSSIPDAFNSKATHFTPIIVSADKDKTNEKQQPAKTGKTSSNIDEKEMAEKIKKLKKNLMKNRLPLTLAADLEQEVMQDRRKVKSVTPTSQGHQKAVQGQGPQVRHQTPPGGVYISPPPGVPVENYNPMLATSTPTALQGQGYLPTSPVVAGNLPGSQGQYYPHQIQQNPLMSTSVPNLAYQYPPMAFQMGFQQDPRTGLFQLVPVPTAMPIQGVTMQPGMHSTSSMGQINLTPPMQGTGPVGHLTPPTGHPGQQVRSPIDKQVSTPSGSSTDGERPERKRHRKRQLKVKERSKQDSTAGSRSLNQNKTRTQSDSSSRVSKGYSSRREDSDRDLSPVLELRAPVPRASSVDLIEKYENGNNAQPRTPRTVKMRDQRNKLKRTKSGSSLDYKNLSSSELKAIEVYDDSKIDCKKVLSNLSRSQPNLESELVEFTPELCIPHSKVTKPRSQRRKTDPASPELPSPPLSPSLSKDSGVSGMNVKSSDMSLMERLLNSDTIRHQQKLSRVVRIVRDEFAYDGYMENGIEDLAMAEYILSLGNLKWETFYSAVTEKYCDLYFEEDVVSALYEAVNGKKPINYKRTSPLVEKLGRGEMRGVSGNKLLQDTGKIQPRPQESYTSEHAHDSNNSPSAFRPIHNGERKAHTPPTQGQAEVIVKPRPTKVQTQDLSYLGSTQTGVHNLEKSEENSVRESSRTSWHSDEDLTEPNNDSANLNNNDERLKSKHEEEDEHKSKHSESNGQKSEIHRNMDDSTSPGEISIDMKQMSKLSYLVRQDSEASDRRKASLRRRLNKNTTNGRAMMLQSKSALEVRPSPLSEGRGEAESPLISISQISSSVHTDLRDHVKTGGYLHQQQGRGGRQMYESDTQMSPARGATEGDRIAAPRPYADMSRLGRGSVVYYWAEMQNKLRTDVKDFAAQIDAKTKESIEGKMGEVEQQMTMEHRNKKKTLKYYRKLVETTKQGKVTTEQRSLLTRVGEQVSESNDRLDFLDRAKKHLEMLHAEQWGLERTLLYALANCPGDSAMLLCACDNPLLQYQLLRSPRLGIEGQILQAGTPHGLMSYLFAQAALSEGYIHQFFYCYRYFTTPQQVFNFLSEKFTAAGLSLGPGAEVPSKVKARAMDLLQVWVEGFYTVDLKDSPLMDEFATFTQERMLPIDESTELIIEVIDRCKDGRHRDLYYPEFSAREDTNNNNSMEEMPIKKWESFKAALTGKSGKGKAGSTPVKEGGRNVEVRGVRRSDSFNLMDYTAQSLAEQLTLMDQVLFQQSHPVHYLNSKHLGVSVSLTNQLLQKAQSINRLNAGLTVGESSNLFAGEAVDCTIVQRLIDHAQNIAFWVAGEIVSCSYAKTQAAVLSKFIYVAKYCQEARNFATCVAIVDGLENLIVRQLPVWKTLPSKCVTAMGELSSLKMLLKSDSLCLLQDQTKRQRPTIPSILYFLLHVQQLEIGGFTLANKMFRWQKMKSIANMIDQIRLFQQNQYLYTNDLDLQQALRTRMCSLTTQDLPTLAQHATNIPKAPSAGKLSLAFKRMSRKMKGGAEA